jgi:hypothetical protein
MYCTNCGDLVPIREGICTDETGRRCAACAETDGD